jgi:hypothetical protein
MKKCRFLEVGLNIVIMYMKIMFPKINNRK